MKAILPAAILALAASPALAHSALDATAPENGAVLAQAPHTVFAFARRIRLTRVRMTHDDGNAVDLDLGRQTAFATRFAPPPVDMGRGVYRIEWRGLSGDGHAMRRAFAFSRRRRFMRRRGTGRAPTCYREETENSPHRLFPR